MGSRKVPFSFPTARLVFFILIASTIFHFQQRPGRAHPTPVQELTSNTEWLRLGDVGRAMGSTTQGTFSYPLAHAILFIFIASTLFHIQRRLVRLQTSSGQDEQIWVSHPGMETLAGRKKPMSHAQLDMWTINSLGRLGNQMGEYATLYALAKMNGHPAFIPAPMHSMLAPIFKISLPVLPSVMERRAPWHNYHLNDWMEERHRNITGLYVRFTGTPCSWTFYHHLRPEILQEFSLHEHVREEAQAFLRGLSVNGSQPRTFVGVHVRRGDYVHVMPNMWKGVVAHRGYLQQAMDRFRARFESPVFVVTSNGMAWSVLHSPAATVAQAPLGTLISPMGDHERLVEVT
ncbi:PREDICTED: galactoside 2-alpha-L-fucosyltransferase 2-like [Dipodomys ordii]|uniref:L-Fucosyltransferase n=1 Tax=Dipodomys ordii TaxID=10020 RepID=A0A1S3G2I7_DIPOR|nr:PREDICTED: galactoside 2-alpha-L-fucosyltransferase 2-like [Dipodomys ordii]